MTDSNPLLQKKTPTLHKWSAPMTSQKCTNFTFFSISHLSNNSLFKIVRHSLSHHVHSRAPKRDPAPLLIRPWNYSTSADLLIWAVCLDARRVRKRGEETDGGRLLVCWGRLWGRLSSLGYNEELTLMSLKVSLRDGRFQRGWSFEYRWRV